MSAPKANSNLPRLEREIGGFADRIPSGVNRAQARMKQRAPTSGITRAVKQDLTVFIGLVRDFSFAIAASVRRLIHIAIHSGSRPGRLKSTAPLQTETVIQKSRASHRENTPEYLFISAGLGLIGICGILILALFLQIKDMKAKIKQAEIELAATRAQLNRVEKLAQPRTEPTPTKQAQTIRPPLSFSDADIKVIRETIKTLPPKSGALQKIHLGDKIGGLSMAPIPESLTAQMPKLRGAKFSIDEDGAIIIIGEGSNRADAVLSYR